MSALAVYIGTSSLSGVFYKSSGDYTFFNYPYVYSEDLFSTFTNEKDFYTSFFDNLAKQLNFKVSGTDIVLGSFLHKPDIGVEPKGFYTIPEIINGFASEKFAFVVNSYSIVTPNDFISYLSLVDETSQTGEGALTTEEINFHHNTSIFNNIVHFDMTTLVDHDKNIVSKIPPKKLSYDNKVPLLFTGSRFAYPYGNVNQEIDYILLLNIVKNPGIFEIELDRNRYVILSQMLKFYDPKIELNAQGKLEKVGTLINTYGEVECMITSEIGTSQLLEIEKDKVFVLPLNYNEKAHVMIKNQAVGTLEKDVTGGKLGLIFDTRGEKYDITNDLKVFNASLKSLGQSLNKI